MKDKHFGVAVKAIIKKGNEFLIIKKSNTETVTPNNYDIPGGRIKFGEDVETALIREIKEETGLNINIKCPTNVWTFKVKDDFQLVGITFLCEFVSGDLLLSEEHESFEWLTSKDIFNREFPKWLIKEFNKIRLKKDN